MTILRRLWRRFRRLHPAAQAALVIAVVAGYTAALVALLGGGSETRTIVQRGAATHRLTPLELQVSRAVRKATLFQNETTDVPAFRQPEIASIRCKTACRVVYSVSVPGRGRLLFQQLNMVRVIFRDTKIVRVVLRVVRVSPHGPSAIPKASEETPPGFPLLETTCDRSRLRKRVNWKTQKEAQAALSKSCSVRAFDQGKFHGGNGGQVQGPG